MALAAARAGSHVVLYTRREQPQFDRRVRITMDLAEVAKNQVVVVAVPTPILREVARSLGDHLTGAHLVVHGVRGLEHERLTTISDVIREETPVRRIGALGGPVQASELHRGQPSAIVCGSKYPEVVEAIRGVFRSKWLHVYGLSDLRGLEWASALVGCVSVGVGFAKGAGAGPGLLAVLVSRAVEEAGRILVAAGAEERTMFGLGGYGDLLASMALTDRPEVVIGRALAQDKSLEEAVAEAHLRVEAIALIPRIVAFAKVRRVKAPTFAALADIFERVPGGTPVERMFGD